MAMVDVVIRSEIHGRESNDSALGIDSGRHDIGAGQSVKEVIGSAVLLENDNDVLNLAGTGSEDALAETPGSRRLRGREIWSTRVWSRKRGETAALAPNHHQRTKHHDTGDLRSHFISSLI